MTLPYDFARCAGTTHPNCQFCRRREPGRDEWQSYVAAPMDTLTGVCELRIGTETAEHDSQTRRPSERDM